MNFHEFGLGIPWLQVVLNIGVLLSLVAEAIGVAEPSHGWVEAGARDSKNLRWL